MGDVSLRPACSAATALVASVAMTLSGCGSAGQKVALFGKEVSASNSDMAVYARRFAVSEDVLRRGADDASESAIWSLGTLSRAYENTPAEIRASVVAAACDVATGGLRSPEEVDEFVMGRVVGMTKIQAIALRDDVYELGEQIQVAVMSEDYPELRMQIAWNCFVAEQVAGLD